jgi:hypothetical protein
MKIFHRESKVNFVDKNNLFVGYDMHQNCCEDAGWFISSQKSENPDETGLEGDFEGYVFDRDFIEIVYAPRLDDGGMVRFKLTKPESPDLYLHLYNVHNGYYSHGFEFTDKNDNTKIKEGWL